MIGEREIRAQTGGMPGEMSALEREQWEIKKREFTYRRRDECSRQVEQLEEILSERKSERDFCERTLRTEWPFRCWYDELVASELTPAEVDLLRKVSKSMPGDISRLPEKCFAEMHYQHTSALLDGKLFGNMSKSAYRHRKRIAFADDRLIESYKSKEEMESFCAQGLGALFSV